MSKRFSKGRSESPAKRFKLDVTKESVQPRKKKSQQNTVNNVEVNDDLWGDDFGEEEIEEMDFIASQATQEEIVFVAPKAKPIEPIKPQKPASFESVPSTSSGYTGKNSQKNNAFNHKIPQSQMIASSDLKKEIMESTQAIMFDDFESDIKSNSLNSTFRNRQDISSNNIVFISDDDQVDKWKEEKKKLLEDFMTKEGETEFLRQQLSQIQARAVKKQQELTHEMEEQAQKYRQEINTLVKDKASLESQLQLQSFEFNAISDKSRMMESGSIKFAQPQVNMIKANKDKSNTSINWTPKKVKTKEMSIQVKESSSVELLKTSLIHYPLNIIPQCAFEPAEPEKSVVEIKIEEKIGKRNLAILQDEETFRIFENPDLTKPKVTIVDGKNLSTEFILPDLAKLKEKTAAEINSTNSIPTINKLIATARELLLNSTLVLQNISQALQNDDIRDMNELYLSEFYEMPVMHTKSTCEARAWYDLERGIETRRAIGVLAHVALVSTYLADYICGNSKLKVTKDPDFEIYASQMKSYSTWNKKGSTFEFLDIVLEFVTVVETIRRSHHFTGLINALVTLITNVQINVGFTQQGLNKVFCILKEITFSRPLLSCFIPMSILLKEFSHQPNFVKKLCISPDKPCTNYWKGSLNFTPDSCTLGIFIAQLGNFNLDPITLINVTQDLAAFSHVGLCSFSIPWLDETISLCHCCIKLLEFVICSLNECSKINVDKLEEKYMEEDISWRLSNIRVKDKKNKMTWKDKLFEDWNRFDQNSKKKFWTSLKTAQLNAIAYGIRLLSFLAKKDPDFLIRVTYIEDAFHLFLCNFNERKDLKLKESDVIALEIVKKIFVLDKAKEDTKINQQTFSIIGLENESEACLPPYDPCSLKKLHESSF